MVEEGGEDVFLGRGGGDAPELPRRMLKDLLAQQVLLLIEGHQVDLEGVWKDRWKVKEWIEGERMDEG